MHTEAVVTIDVAPEPVIEAPGGWKRRLEDPLNTYYRYPVALAIVRLLMKTSVTPNQVSLVQPIFAAASGYLLTFSDWRYHLGAVLLFELRSILDCVDGSLARAKKLSSPNGHAIDALADWLGVVLLYAGISHYVVHHLPSGVSLTLALAVLASALAQGALRSVASDYFKQKYLGIFERSRDTAAETLRDKVLALREKGSLFAHADVFIMRTGYLLFEGRSFSPERCAPLSEGAVNGMVDEQHGPEAKRIGFWWSISSGDAFLSFVILSILAGQIWEGQVLFATFGWLWIVGVVLYNMAFVRRHRDRHSALAA